MPFTKALHMQIMKHKFGSVKSVKAQYVKLGFSDDR